MGNKKPKLTNADIKNAVNECLAEDAKMGDCPNNKYGVMSEWDTSKVTDMSGLFQDPPRADSSDPTSSFNGIIGNWNVKSVTNMANMFKYADAYTGKNLYQWDVSKVTDMSGMFEHASSFTAQLGGWNVEHVTAMNTMFQNAFKFNSDITQWHPYVAKDITRMFAGV